MNAIFFAAILMASRFEKISSVFVLLSINLIFFGFAPTLRHDLRRKNILYFEIYTLVLIGFNVVLIFCISHLLCIVYACIICFISFGVPLLFIYAYSFKNDVRGPWDLPKVRDY